MSTIAAKIDPSVPMSGHNRPEVRFCRNKKAAASDRSLNLRPAALRMEVRRVGGNAVKLQIPNDLQCAADIASHFALRFCDASFLAHYSASIAVMPRGISSGTSGSTLTVSGEVSMVRLFCAAANCHAISVMVA